jgi:glycosyltransferase involved in cell wall biosynthesis
MLLSIIIPTYNEEKDIGDCLNSLKEQSYKNFEIIVVDDGSTDKTREIVGKFKKIKLIEGEHKGPGFSRNLGAKKAKGEVLIFVDADMTFDKDYLKNLLKPILENEKVIGTTHDYEEATNLDSIWSRCWGNVRVDYRGESNEGVIFRAIRKNKFLEFKGFNPKYGYADDQTFWYEQKVKPVVAKNTNCYHKNPETLKEVYVQSKWIGASIKNKFTENLILKHIFPILLILVSPIMIILISFKKNFERKDLRLFFPMFIFIAVRYFGVLRGIIKGLRGEFNK